MIAHAMIVNNTEEEAQLLDQCLQNVYPFVDKIFITVTTHNDDVKPIFYELEKKYDFVLSTFEWVHDFSKARNFNFSQTKGYDYILWCDADDTFEGLETIKDVIKEHPEVDAYGMHYLYDIDEYGQPTVVHKKIQLLKQESFEWVGRIHEDLMPIREVNPYLLDIVKRIHHPTTKRAEQSAERNLEIAKQEYDGSPRAKWNMANAYMGIGASLSAIPYYEQFIEETGSDEERYIAYCRLGSISEFNKAVNYFRMAIGLRPDFAEAYIDLGNLYFKKDNIQEAHRYILTALTKKPSLTSLLIFNPRDYDYNVLMLLVKIYMGMSRPDLAIPAMEGCLKIYPQHPYLKDLLPELKKEKERMDRVVQKVKDFATLSNDELIEAIKSMPKDEQSHPAVVAIKNERIIKTETSGKDICYYCGMTQHEWNPILFKEKGFGGSEEAVVNLSREWAKRGYNVTVFNNCGPEEMTVDGVTYKPFWTFNVKDKYDTIIVWRHPRILDYDLQSDNILVDMHDVIQPGEFTSKRLEKLTAVMFKTEFHRSLFPNVPNEKCRIVSNGIDTSMFKGDKRDPYLLINTSSPDRSMDVLPKLFKEVKKQVPQAKCVWAYGWDVFDDTFKNDKAKMEWKENLVKQIDEAGIVSLGKIPQHECAKLYEQGRILAYPSEFAEISCISVLKSQYAGCVPITSDFGAFKETNKYGVQIHSDKTNETWAQRDTFGLETNHDKWVEAVVKELKKPFREKRAMRNWTKQFDWGIISEQWQL